MADVGPSTLTAFQSCGTANARVLRFSLAPAQFDLLPLHVVLAGLCEGAPALGGGEGGAEVLGRDPRGESRCVPSGRGTRTRHRARNTPQLAIAAGVVVAALDLVEGVVLGRVVALVDAAADGQGLGDHALPDHVAGHLVLDAGPDLVAVAHAFGPGAGSWARCR